jgi:magnesium-transporting ATPase (P-type)
MNEGLLFYLLFTSISLYLSKKNGNIRNIGFYWSVAFSIFCPMISILIIFCSKKKDDIVGIPNITKWGVLGLIILILNIYGGYPDSLFKFLGSLTLPFSVFLYKLSGETFGKMVVDNLFVIFPFYGLLRKYTQKYLT